MAVKTKRSEKSFPKEISQALAEIDYIAQKRYQTNYEKLIRNGNRNQAAFQMRHIVGVALKKEYSDERPLRNAKRQLIDYKWEISPAKLDAMPKNAWQFEVLASTGADGKAVALTLRRETLLQRHYFGLIHPYLCQDEKTRVEIKKLLKECGLGEFAGLATPKGMVKIGTAKLFVVLSVVIGSALPAAAIAVAALSICVIGLNRICRSANELELSAKDKALPQKKKKKKKLSKKEHPNSSAA